MIVLPSARGRVEPVLFRFDARDCIDDVGIFARSFGQKVYGVFSRASAKRVGDQRGMLSAIPSGMPPLSRAGGEQALIFEPAGSNLCTRSDDYSNAAWNKVRASVSAVPLLAAYFLAEDSTAANTHHMWATSAAFTADSHLTASLDVRPGSRTKLRLVVWSNSGANRFHVTFDLVARAVLSETAAGTGSVVAGSGRVVGPDADGFYRVSIAGKVDPAATSCALEIGLMNDVPSAAYDGDGSSGLYVRRAQVEAAQTASSFSPTDGAASTRSTDSLYFPYSAPPQAMTVYHRQVHLGAFSPNTGSSRRFLVIGNSGITGARFGLNGSSADNAIQANYGDGATSVSSFQGGGTTVAQGSVVEVRAVLRSDWTVHVGRSIGGGAEALSSVSAPSGPAGAFAQPRLWLAGMGSFVASAPTHVVVAAGERTIDEMRALAGV